MYVNIQYWKPEISAYGGKSYLYRTELPLKTGDLVIAPTYKGDQRAIVTRTNVPDREVDPAWSSRIRAVTEYDPGEQVAARARC